MILEGALIGLTMTSGWFATTATLSRRRVKRQLGGARAREALVEFTERALEIDSAGAVLAFAGEAAQVVFGSRRAVAIEPAAEPGHWEASIVGGGLLGPLPGNLRSVFGWFRHNAVISAEVDLGQPRYGAMRAPLRELFKTYDIDVLLPMVKGNSVHAALGLKLGRAPSALDRELLRLFRMQVTAACANLRLHREAAQIVSLAKELDLASSVELALAPASPDGAGRGVRWAGHFETAGDAPSDFWSAHQLSDGRLALIIGDAIRSELAGSMVSAVIKSCADEIVERPPARFDPGVLLGMLGRALRQRVESAGQASCFAAFFDPVRGEVSFSNAGHPAPYVAEPDGEGGIRLGSLSRPGPLLGDAPDESYPTVSRKLEPGSSVVLFTDGLSGGGGGTRVGDKRLQRLLRRKGGLPAAELRDAIALDTREARAGARPRDDAAFVVVRLDVG